MGCGPARPQCWPGGLLGKEKSDVKGRRVLAIPSHVTLGVQSTHAPGPTLVGTYLLPQVQQRKLFPNVPKLVPPHPSTYPTWKPNPNSPLPSLDS